MMAPWLVNSSRYTVDIRSTAHLNGSVYWMNRECGGAPLANYLELDLQRNIRRLHAVGECPN
jgi:hypothetical protein